MWSSRPAWGPWPAATISVLRATVASRVWSRVGSVVLRKDPNVGTPRGNPAQDGVRRERISLRSGAQRAVADTCQPDTAATQPRAAGLVTGG